MKILKIAIILLTCLMFTVTATEAGRRKKTTVKYKCFNTAGERVVCPENFKQSPGFKKYLRQKKAKLHDTRRHYYTDEDREDTSERTYYDDADSARTYYDETIREEAND